MVFGLESLMAVILGIFMKDQEVNWLGRVFIVAYAIAAVLSLWFYATDCSFRACKVLAERQQMEKQR
jgi:uncharacterized membrane protein YqjE